MSSIHMSTPTNEKSNAESSNLAESMPNANTMPILDRKRKLHEESQKSVKRMKYHKAINENEKNIFNDWLNKSCIIQVQEPAIHTVCVQLRKQAPNSYENYCKSVNAKPLTMKQFNSVIKEKIGSIPKIRHKRKLAFDHIQLKIVEPTIATSIESPLKTLKRPSIEIVPNNILGSASKMCTPGGDSWTTPLTQYKGLKPLIDLVSMGKRLTILDPFYCDGSGGKYMAQTFNNSVIIHEDRKIDLIASQLPEFAQNTDLIVTNPPFSQARSVVEYMLSLKIPFLCLLPVSFATNKTTNPLIWEHKIQIIRTNGRIAFEKPGSNEAGQTGSRDCQWYCHGLDLPAEVQYWCVDKLHYQIKDVTTRPK